nr:hypothetical protein GCM10020185_12470 [Pseudomonas brassicacearum subsp. brassicacearum]
MAGAAQDVSQLHGVGAKGTDNKELFADCGGWTCSIPKAMSGRYFCRSTQRQARKKTNGSSLVPRVALHSATAGTHQDKPGIGACGDENGGWKPAYELVGTDQSLKGSENHRQGEW